MTRLASLALLFALLLATALPALGQGLILGAPAQGAGGGGGISAVEVDGDGLSGDGSAGDPLTLGAVLQALSDLSVVDNTLIRGHGTGDLQGSDATLSDAELLDLTDTGGLIASFLAVGTGQTTSDVRMETNSGRLDVREGDDSALADLGAALIAVADTSLDYHSVLSAASLTAANTRAISLTNGGVPALRAYAASATAGNGNYMGFSRFGGTLASPTAVTAGDTILAIYGRQAATASITGDLEAAAITFETDGAVGAGDSPGRICIWTNTDGSGNSATKKWEFDNAGHLLATTDNSWDIGASGATRPRTIYAGTRFLGPAGSASAATWGFSATTGMFGVDATSISLTINNTEEQRLTASALDRGPDQVVFGASIGSPDVGLVRDAAGVLRVSDASTGDGDFAVDDLIIGQRSGNGFMFQSTGNGNMSIIDGDGTALAGSSETINFGDMVLRPDALSPAAVNYGWASDPNTGLSRVEADAPAIAAEGQWRQIVSNTLTITEGTASNLVTIPLASGAAVAGSMRVFIGLTDGTDTIRMVRAVHFTAIDKGGVLTSSINTDGSTVGHSTNGGYTVDDGPTFAVADGTNAISITLDVGATGTNTVTVAWALDLHHSAAGQLVTIP